MRSPRYLGAILTGLSLGALLGGWSAAALGADEREALTAASPPAMQQPVATEPSVTAETSAPAAEAAPGACRPHRRRAADPARPAPRQDPSAASPCSTPMAGAMPRCRRGSRLTRTAWTAIATPLVPCTANGGTPRQHTIAGWMPSAPGRGPAGAVRLRRDLTHRDARFATARDAFTYAALAFRRTDPPVKVHPPARQRLPRVPEPDGTQHVRVIGWGGIDARWSPAEATRPAGAAPPPPIGSDPGGGSRWR